MRGDPDRLRQALINLIDNAVKHSPPGGGVRLDLYTDSGRVQISVADCGPGIPPEVLPRVFEPFFRASSLESSGAGLGLAIARWIIQEHGGEIAVNTSPGQGACVTLSLPELVAPEPQSLLT